MRNYLYFLLFTLALLSGCDQSSPTPPRLLINEVMARNETITYFEEDGLPAMDWVEIYNPDYHKEQRLDGYTLSDNLERPKKYKFPAALIIGPRQCLVVTLAGPGRSVDWYDYDPGNPFRLRADFALNAQRDTVYLFANGRQIDWLVIRNLDADTSIGRDPRDRDSIGRSFAPSPGEPNLGHGILRTRFAAGKTPQEDLCTPADEPVRLRFTILAHTDDSPEVRLKYKEVAAESECDTVIPDEEVQLEYDEILCQGGEGELDPQCPQETVDGSYGNQSIKVRIYEALLPSASNLALGDEATIRWELTIKSETIRDEDTFNSFVDRDGDDREHPNPELEGTTTEREGTITEVR